TYHLLLLDPAGVHPQPPQSLGHFLDRNGGGELVFSPDGTMLARYNPLHDLQLFDFDRCSGLLSNPRHISWQDTSDIEIFGGLAFSADSRYLYVAAGVVAYQFDMQASDIAASRTAVAWYDNFGCPFACTFHRLELAPDGTIIGTPADGSFAFHRIRHPERAGAACDFRQQDIKIQYGYDNLPHFPVFRLGPVDGSPCDTLGLDNRPLAGWRHAAQALAVDFTSVSWYEPTAWHWDFGDGGTSTAVHPTHAYAAPGGYDVCLTVSNANGSDTKCRKIWVGVSRTDDPIWAAGFSLQPNPTSGQISAIFPETMREDGQITVFDATGRKVSAVNFTGESRVELDLSLLPDGLYSVLVRVGNENLMRKIIVAK
ncbi:MAG: PKD domain-containing protein, partial [Saprospiraceae bacterium]